MHHAAPHVPPQQRSSASTSRPAQSSRGKYVIERPLGSGWEGEVYVIIEQPPASAGPPSFITPTAIRLGKAAITYARKLDALRHCPILMQYHHQEIAYVQQAEGRWSSSANWSKARSSASSSPSSRDHRLSTFEALHVLYVLAKGIAPIHARGEYHGDIHDDNIMIRRQGIGFEVKLLDFFDLGKPTTSKIHKDVLNLIEVFHTIVGGRERYAQPAEGREGHHPRPKGLR